MPIPNNRPLIIDTHIWIWLMEGSRQLSKPEVAAIETAAQQGMLRIPVICVWEVAMLHQKEKIQIRLPCQQWIETSLSLPGMTIAPLSPEIAYESTILPGDVHGDPADRMIMATTRILNGILLTHDQGLRRYAKKGWLTLFQP